MQDRNLCNVSVCEQDRAAVVWFTLGLLPTGSATVLIIFGALASATRGFAPEAANLWVLETFATEQRATCYAAANVVFNVAGSAAVPLGGLAVSALDYSPTPLLIGYALIHLALGAFTYFLPNETVNTALKDRVED